jgi:hypothetical protein
MRNRSILALVLALAAGACAPADDTDAGMADDAAMEDDAGMMEDDPTFAPAGPATGLPEGYAMRLDREDAAAADFHVEQGDGSMMIRTGPAGILYNEEEGHRLCRRRWGNFWSGPGPGSEDLRRGQS